MFFLSECHPRSKGLSMRLQWKRLIPGFVRSRIASNPQLQGIVSNTGWMMGDNIIRKAVGLLVGVLLARHLGPQLYGEFSYAIAFVSILAPIAVLSLDAISVQRIVQKPSCTNEVLGTSFTMMIGGGIVAFALATAAIFLVRPDDRLSQWLVIILAAGTIVQAFFIIEVWFFSQVQSKYTVFAKTSSFLILSIVKIVLILLQAPLVAFAWASLAETALCSVGLLIVYRFKGYSLKTWRFSYSTAKSMLQDSWPLILSSFLAMVYLRIDQIMLGNIVGSEELGKYAIAVQFSEVWYFIPMIICGSVAPALIEAEAFSEELFYSRLQRLFNLIAIFTYVVAIPITFFSDEIINVLFDSAYSEAGPLLAILVWTGLFTCLGLARHVMVVAKSWTRINLVSIALGCAMNIFLNFLLIPDYGGMGAVIATFVSYWFTVHGSCFLFKPLRKAGWMMAKAMIYPKFW